MRSKVVILLAAAFSLGVVQAASAADMPVKGPIYKAPVAVPAVSWTGLYVGLNGGYGWGGHDWNLARVPTGSSNMTGGLFGGQLGYNWQVNEQIVLGVQADGDWADIKGLAPSPFLDGRCAGGFSDQSADCSSKVKSLATLTGRVGFLPWDNTLVYGKAGIAWSSIDLSVTNVIDVNSGTCGLLGTNKGGYNTNRHTKTAFTAGAGVEQRIWDRVSVFGEYDYVDHRETTNDFNTGGSGAGGCTANFTCTTHFKPLNIIKFGVNVKLW